MTNRTLTDGSPVPEDGSHTQIDPKTGLQKGYVILSEEERAKGFVRPVRRTYVHVGVRPEFPTFPLTEDQQRMLGEHDYVLYEPYPKEAGRSAIGRYWTRAQLESGCGVATTMGQSLAETYAREPGFYGGTYCVGCGTHFPVGAKGEFIWDDGSKVGT
jgi:hypothetical protein